MSIMWHPKRWCNFCMSEMRKKKENRFLLSNAFNVYNLSVLKRFLTRNFLLII